MGPRNQVSKIGHILKKGFCPCLLHIDTLSSQARKHAHTHNVTPAHMQWGFIAARLVCYGYYGWVSLYQTASEAQQDGLLHNFEHGAHNIQALKTITHLKPTLFTLENLSRGSFEVMIGSMILLLPNTTSGIYNAQATWAHPPESVRFRAPSFLGHSSHRCRQNKAKDLLWHYLGLTD